MGGDLGQSSNTGHVTKEAAAPQDVFCPQRRDCPSYSSSLPCEQTFVGDHFRSYGFKWVFPKTVKEAIINWGVLLLEKKKEKDLEINSVVHILDSLD